MSEPTLTPAQTLLVFSVLARHGECPQAELELKVKPGDREALVKARLITSEKVGRGLYLKLDDRGWAWAAAHLPAELPPAQGGLQQLLTRLGEYLARSGKTLADFIGSKPEPPPSPKTDKPKQTVRRSKTPSPGPNRSKSTGKPSPVPPPADARAMILRAYSEITGGRSDTDVRLADLRARLPHLNRNAFDAALTEMHLESGKARLVPIESARAETEADRQSAFHFKGSVFHALWIQS